MRSDLNILDDAEESKLHESGLVLANTADLAHEVMELRDKKEKIIQANNPQKSTTVSGTRSRPKCV